jgi:hypothetical protein
MQQCLFVGFQPAVSPGALKEMGQRIRRWRIHTRTRHDLNELARAINPIVAGWMHYYGRFYRSQMHPLLHRINTYLMRWAGKKYKRLRSYKRFKAWWLGSSIETPSCSPTGPGRASWQDCDEKSGVTGDSHVPFCGSPGLCPEFARTEGSSAGTGGASCSMGCSGPWVRGNRQRGARRRSPGAGVRWSRT